VASVAGRLGQPKAWVAASFLPLAWAWMPKTSFRKNSGTIDLAINDIEHTKTKVKSPQTNGICERFHKTILQEFYQVALRKNLYNDLHSLQKDLDDWLVYYNNERTYQGKMCCGRTPMSTLLDGKTVWSEKFLG
jgi:hypothetical protein